MQSSSGADLPAGAVDTHVHVFEPARFPYHPGRGYTPGPASVAQLAAFHAGLGVRRTVLVQPSPYGDDNAALLDALGRYGSAARGIAVVADDLSDEDANALRARGVAGLRLNFGSGHDTGDLRRTCRALRLAARHGFLVEVYAPLPVLRPYLETFATAEVPVLLDHFAGADAREGVTQEGFREVLDLVADGPGWFKVSGQHRAAPAYPDRAGLADILHAVAEAGPDRLVWGSDWPHTAGAAARAGRGTSTVEPFRGIDDRADLAWLREQLGQEQQHALFEHNPSRLFGL